MAVARDAAANLIESAGTARPIARLGISFRAAPSEMTLTSRRIQAPATQLHRPPATSLPSAFNQLVKGLCAPGPDCLIAPFFSEKKVPRPQSTASHCQSGPQGKIAGNTQSIPLPGVLSRIESSASNAKRGQTFPSWNQTVRGGSGILRSRARIRQKSRARARNYCRYCRIGRTIDSRKMRHRGSITPAERATLRSDRRNSSYKL